MVDQEKIQQAVRLLLEGMGEDVEREGLLETPQRVGRMYAEICRGMDESASEHLSTTFSIDSDDMVVERDIQFYSLCEHHLLPFYGKVHLAYIPNGRVTGLSKLARTVEVFSSTPAAAGAIDFANRRCAYGRFGREGRSCHGRGRAHVHVDARCEPSRALRPQRLQSVVSSKAIKRWLMNSSA